MIEFFDLIVSERAATSAKPTFTQQILVSSAEMRVVVVDGDLDAMARADAPPSFEVGVIAVDESAVEVEDCCVPK